jgi:deoxyribonuclease-4
MTSRPFIGAHLSTLSTSIKEALQSVVKHKGNVLQTFLVSSNSKYIINKETSDLETAKKYADKNNCKIFIHSSYYHNISRAWQPDSFWVGSIMKEIKLAHQLGASGLIVHLGKQLNLTQKDAYNNMFTFLLYIHNNTLQYSDVKIILETSSGQGSEMCYTLEDLGYFYNKFSVNKEIKNRFRICIDTCHIFAAGYDISTQKGVDKYLKKFNNLIGLDNVNVIHLNDSKSELGSRKDRHANIGKGNIGLKSLKYCFKIFSDKKIPMILETHNNGYVWEIKKLLENVNN